MTQEDMFFYVTLYAIGWPLSFYVLARWNYKQCNASGEGLAIAWVSSFWPIIFTGVLLWYSLDFAFKVVNLIGKPFDKFYDWSTRHDR